MERIREIRGGVLAVICLLTLGASAVTVAVDPDCAEMGSVAWSEKPLRNGTSRLTLKATAADGFAFRGWSVDEKSVVAWPDDLRCPGSLSVTVASNAVVLASFLACEDDTLSFDISNLFPEEIEYGTDFSETLAVFSESFPTVTFRNLPHGLSFDARTLMVFGKPDAPGLYRIVADAVNESGFTFRSCSTMRVLNAEGARVTGFDEEIAVDDYWFADSSNLFYFAEEPTSIAVSADVPGLTWNEKWQLLYGVPTEIGDYTIKATVRFPTGRVETATMTLAVTGPEPEDYGLDFGWLEYLQVGDAMDDSCLLGEDGADFRIAGVSGLPTGLSVESRYEDGARRWFFTGQVREPGFFTVVVRVEDLSDTQPRTAKVVRTIAVSDVADVYLAVKSDDLSRGTVSGGGAVSPFDDVTLEALPKAGFVFSGWYDSDGERLVLNEGVDYRTGKITLPAGTDFSFLSPVAQFASKTDDVAPDLSEIDESDFSVVPDEASEMEFEVESLSLPTLTFKGLPQSVACTATGAGGFVLAYDPSAAEAASGRYAVTVTAVNASGAKSTASFRATVGNRTDSRINVGDDYGEFMPGEEIDPIDLSDAVDFERGETLSVSGLPKGLVYNSKANEKKGIEAHTITGTPTVPGDYTLAFTAKVVSDETTNRQGVVSYKYVTAKATSFLTVLAYPELAIEVDEDASSVGCKVTGSGNYKEGTKVSIKATAAKGWVFAGWDGFDDLDGLAALNPKLSYVTGGDDVWVQANFAPLSEDGLTVAEPSLTEFGFAAEWPLKEVLGEDDAALISDLIETVSWPTVKVAGLPTGVKFSASTLALSGTPTKSGVYHVTVTAKSAGGYSFVRVLDVAVLNDDGSVPTEKALVNAAEIDFDPLGGLTTGVYCPTGSVLLAIGSKPLTGSPVKKVSLSGLPAGLTARTSLQNGGATVEVTGTPTKPGRQIVSVSVAYGDGKTLKSQAAIVVQDGGSAYLFVVSHDSDAGTVSGEGVYASGATVKLVARPKSKQVFSGWCVPGEEGEYLLFEPLREIDGIDPRSASVAFPFRPADISPGFEITGTFEPSASDVDAEIDLESDCWQIDPVQSSSFSFATRSLSVPKVTVTGLPKGVSVDVVRGLLTYAPAATTEPGIYTATVSAKNTTQKKASTLSFEIQVANRVSDVIDGLDPDMAAYPLSVGTTLNPTLITPQVPADWKLTAKGLPSGLSFKNGAVTGVPSKAGNYTVTFTATSGKGKTLKTETATITLRISSLPTTLSGTFTGVLAESADAVDIGSSSAAIIGTVTVTATAAGKISVSAKTAAGTTAFSAKSWDVFTNGVASVALAAKGGRTCLLSVVETDDWQSWQATGSVDLGTGPLVFSAQRNPYGAKDGSPDAREAVGQMIGTSLFDGWKVAIKAKGVVSFTGTSGGKSYSGSTIMQWVENAPFARYVKFVNKNTNVCIVFRFDGEGQVVGVAVVQTP